MDRDLESRAEEIFAKAVALPPEERPALLERRCGGETALRDRVEALLRSHEEVQPLFGTEGLPKPAREALNAAADEARPQRGPRDLSGQTLSHYRLIEKIGEGGMGVVWKAEDTVLNRTVAIKVLPADLALDEKRRRMFLDEARLAASVSHGNIVQVHELGREGDLDFIVMEYIDGQPLSKVLNGNPLAQEKIADWGLQIAEGLARAHRKGLIHRDLKPANLLVTPDNEVKIVDFGLAVLFQHCDSTVSLASNWSETASEEARTRIAGTLPYMSPEQVRGERLDGRSDIFSFGTVLYEMTTGQRPFLGATAPAIAQEILKCQPRPVHELLPKVPLDLHRIIEKALARRREDRFQIIDDAAVDLRKFLRDLGSGVALPYRSLKVVRRTRSRFLWSTAAAAVVIAVIAVVWFGRARGPSTRSGVTEKQAGTPWPADVASIAVLPFVNMSDDAANEYFSDGISEELLNAFAQIPGLKVAGRTSSFSFKGRNEDLRVIGQKLNVGTILEGSVRKSGHQLRITAQLVNTADGFHLWSESYDRPLDDILAVQEDIANSVVQALSVTFLHDIKKKPPAKRTSGEAYDMVLLGAHFCDLGSKRDLETGVRYYQQALEVDSSYANAWAGLAFAYNQQAHKGWSPLAEGMRQAREAATHALALDPNSVRAHLALAAIKFAFDLDYSGAESELRQALAFGSGDVSVLLFAVALSRAIGRLEESLALGHRAADLEPLSGSVYAQLGGCYWYAGRLPEAESALKMSLSLSPRRAALHSSLGYVYLAQDRLDVAIAEIKQETRPAARLQGLAIAYHAMRQFDEADKAIHELVERYQGTADFQIAEVYASWNQANLAFEWLDRSFLSRDPGLPAKFKGDPLLENIKNDPRYAVLLEKLGLSV